MDPRAGSWCARRLRSFGPGLTTANILDSESKISPLSSPLGTSPESSKPQNCWGLVCPRGRLDRSRGLATMARSAVARLLRSGGTVSLRWPHWYRCGARAAVAPPAAACRAQHAAGYPAAALQPLRRAARCQPCSLGATRACRRGQISDLDGGQPVAPGRLRRFMRRQAGVGGPPTRAAPEAPSSLPTLRWREQDSNPRSPVYGELGAPDAIRYLKPL